MIPSLVLLDLMLPGTDGVELMKDILDLVDVPDHIPVGLQPGGRRGEGLRHGSGRLRGEAVLSYRTGGENKGGPTQANMSGTGSSPRDTLQAGRPDD